MNLKALSIGCAVPRAGFDAVVHSTFPSAVNLRLQGAGRLITLVVFEEADLPQGIRVGSPAGFSFEVLQKGESATCRGNVLRSGLLTIDLERAARWSCDLPALGADLAKPAAAAAWRFAWAKLNERQLESDAEIVAGDLIHPGRRPRGGISRKAPEAVRGLVEAARSFDPDAASAIMQLIGLGPGLTPSGDDLLGGCLAGLWCGARQAGGRLRFIAGLGKAVIRRSRETNDISRTYLRLAARGQVSSRLSDLAARISQGAEPGLLLPVLDSAMRVGHTSGMDSVTGLLIGLAAWADPLPF
jgi:hypothetical protein